MDPELAPLVDLVPPLDFSDLAGIRRGIAEVIASGATAVDQEALGVTITERTVPGPPGAPEVPVRLYRPAGDQVLPLLLYFHGGAFVMGGAALFDGLCAAYAAQAEVVVVSVEYRLAPEDPFPAGAEDCYAALEWAVGHAGELGADPWAVAVAGSSAGGGLAAAVALMARDRGGPALRFQLLGYPVLDDRLQTVSSRTMANAPVWNSANTAVMWDLYLGPTRGVVSPYAAPARAEHLAGLPSAYVLTCELDPLRDEGLAYAQRLLEAGVSVEVHNWAGAFHGFDCFPSPVSERAVAEQAAALRRAFA